MALSFPTSERFDALLATGKARPVLLQGVFPFLGDGLMNPRLLSPELVYTVPEDARATLIYFRGGNASDQLIYLSVVGNGQARRYFPIGPQGDSHVALAITEDIPGGTRLEIHLAAGAGVLGTAILDVGFLEWKE
ncbi:MAG TPA: hypothetical protein VKU00_18485 [Chthonomonadaceae bacterium]|nr:hypothetical protein [Chthonomonadaceae bacterium]